jgi:hypothetical protein
VELDAVARLRILAAALPHVSCEERVIQAPFERIWTLVEDLEGGVPQFEGNVNRIEILSRDGERVECVSHGPLGSSLHVHAILRPGWCVMRSRLADIGMAAIPLGDGATRFAHFEGSRWLGRAGRPLFRRFVHQDLARLARLTEV